MRHPHIIRLLHFQMIVCVYSKLREAYDDNFEFSVFTKIERSMMICTFPYMLDRHVRFLQHNSLNKVIHTSYLYLEDHHLFQFSTNLRWSLWLLFVSRLFVRLLLRLKTFSFYVFQPNLNTFPEPIGHFKQILATHPSVGGSVIKWMRGPFQRETKTILAKY